MKCRLLRRWSTRLERTTMTSSWTDWSIATFRWETDYKRLKIVQPWSQQVGYLIVDHEETPELLQVVFKTLRTLDKLGNHHIHSQDKHWDECIPKEIPYTIAAEKYKKKEFEGSAQVDRLHNKLIIMWKNFHNKNNISGNLGHQGGRQGVQLHVPHKVRGSCWHIFSSSGDFLSFSP